MVASNYRVFKHVHSLLDQKFFLHACEGRPSSAMLCCGLFFRDCCRGGWYRAGVDTCVLSIQLGAKKICSYTQFIFARSMLCHGPAMGTRDRFSLVHSYLFPLLLHLWFPQINMHNFDWSHTALALDLESNFGTLMLEFCVRFNNLKKKTVDFLAHRELWFL